MIRLILSLPENIAQTTQEDQPVSAIQTIFSNYILPMPNTIAYNNTIILDAIVQDDFNTNALDTLNIAYTILAKYKWNGISTEMTTIIPLSQDFINYLPQDSTLNIPNNWAGWPEEV